MRTAFITGATSGIGKAAATRLAGENYRLILCGRRKEILEELAGELAQKTDVYTLTSMSEISKKYRMLSQAFLQNGKL